VRGWRIWIQSDALLLATLQIGGLGCPNSYEPHPPLEGTYDLVLSDPAEPVPGLAACPETLAGVGVGQAIRLTLERTTGNRYEGIAEVSIAGAAAELPVSGAYTHGSDPQAGDSMGLAVSAMRDDIDLEGCDGEWTLAIGLGCCDEDGARSTVERRYQTPGFGACGSFDGFCVDSFEAVTRYLGEI